MHKLKFNGEQQTEKKIKQEKVKLKVVVVEKLKENDENVKEKLWEEEWGKETETSEKMFCKVLQF